jgi:hypothetical protein
MLSVYFWPNRSVLRPFGIFCGQLVYFVAIWYILRSFGMLYKDKSGSTGPEPIVSYNASAVKPYNTTMLVIA